MVSIVSGIDMLEALGGGNKPTGIWRLVIGTLSAAAVLGWVIVGWFARDELSLLRDAQTALVTSLAATNASSTAHVSADIDARSQAAQARFGLDTRVTKVEQVQIDLHQEIIHSQQQNEDQTKSIYGQLGSIRDSIDKLGRDVSSLQGRLESGVPR